MNSLEISYIGSACGKNKYESRSKTMLLLLCRQYKDIYKNAMYKCGAFTTLDPECKTYDSQLKKIYSEYKKTVQSPNDFNCMLHYAGPGCSIDWHTDAPTKDDTTGNSKTSGITVFMNKEWKDSWGGQFMYKNNFSDWGGKFIEPVYNMAIMNTGLEPHGVAPVSYGASPRLTFQIFLDRDCIND